MLEPTSTAISPAGATVAVPQRLTDLLLGSQLITRAQLADAEEECGKSGEFLAKILVQRRYITQDDINTCFVKQCKIPHISLMDYDIGTEVLKLIPKEVCLQYGLLPIDKLGRILTVAMLDPLDGEALQSIRAICPELRIKPILCNWAHFEQAAHKYFSGADKKTEETSMATFGLSTLPPRPASAPKLASAPILATSASAGAVPLSAPLDTGALVGAIQAGFREIMQEFSARIAPPSESHAAPATLSPELLVGVMRDSIREAMVDALKSVEHPMAPITAGTQASPDWSGFEQAFRRMLEELKESLRPNLPPLAGNGSPVLATSPSIEQVLQELIGVIKRQSPSGEAMSELIREGIGGAMEDMLATLIVQLKTSPGHSESGPAALESVAAALRETQEGIVSTMREVIDATRHAQDLQGARLAELAEAAVHTTQQTSQLVEASLVQNERMHNLRQGKRAQHASVSSFGAAPQEAAALHVQEDERVRDALEAEVPLERLTFDTFFAGKANAFTLKMAQSVAERPGGEYNPLFLFGNVGLGKTHLISAAGNHIRQAHPGHRVGYVSASHFSRRLKEALAADAQDAFRENYCHWDVLILDDIQFLGGRVEAQEEFFHIFNVLHQQGRQIIIASDKAPDRLGLLEQRLISRFSSGIVADLKPPEWETRMQILRRHAGVAAVQIPEEILSLIATRVSNDIRKMVGSLRKIAAFASMTNEPVTVEMAAEVLSHLGGEEAA